jgi:hypothetical protein
LLAIALAAIAGCASQPPSFPESIDRDRTVVVLVLHADDRAAFDQFLPTFQSWVQSYRPLEHLAR